MLSPESFRWTPGIGDPTPLGWFTVAIYFAVAAQCVSNVRAARHSRDRWAWIGMSALMFCLGLNKQLDLQSWVTQLGRDLAVAQGWYASRRPVQLGFIAGIGTLSLLLLATAAVVLRGQWRRYWLVSAGLVLLLFFIVARATTFHHIDSMLGWRLGVLRVNHVLELAALGLVSLGAWRWRRDPASGHQVVLA